VSLKLHLATEFHLYNAKRRVAELEPITEEVFMSKKVELSGAISTNSGAVWKCVPCSKQFKSIE
jgi:hypothetical protein